MKDPYNESPYRYLIGIIKEQQKYNTKDIPSHDDFINLLQNECLSKLTPTTIQTILEEDGNSMTDSNDNDDIVNSCSNYTSARIDLLELIGDINSLELVRVYI